MRLIDSMSMYTKRKLIGILFLLPITVIMAIFFILPVLLTFRYSFFDWDGISSDTKFVGLDNYFNLFGTADIRYSIINTILLFTLGTVLINTIALMISLLLDNKGLLNRSIYKTAIFLPTILSAVVVALIWKAVYQYDGGMLNSLLMGLGLKGWMRDWLGEPVLVMVCLTIAYVWYQIGTTMVIYLAGLQNIPTELYESAQIDGATRWRQIVNITIPMLAPSITVNVIFVSLSALKTFDFPYALTGGGPGYFSQVVSLRIFNYAFKTIAFGEGTAFAVLFTIFILMISLFQVKVLRKREEIF